MNKREKTGQIKQAKNNNKGSINCHILIKFKCTVTDKKKLEVNNINYNIKNIQVTGTKMNTFLYLNPTEIKYHICFFI